MERRQGAKPAPIFPACSTAIDSATIGQIVTCETTRRFGPSVITTFITTTKTDSGDPFFTSTTTTISSTTSGLPNSSGAEVGKPPATMTTTTPFGEEIPAPTTLTTSSASLSEATNIPAQATTSSVPAGQAQGGTSSKGLQAGPVAGVAIGCLLAGILIAGAIAFLLLRRRNSQQKEDDASKIWQREKIITPPSTQHSPITPGTVIDANLPPPTAPSIITDEMIQLCRAIKNHVQGFYDLDSELSSEVSQQMVVGLGNNLQIPAPTINAWLSSPRSRQSALQFCISWTVFSAVAFGHDINPEISLLPPEVAGCAVTMSSMEHDPRTRLAFLSQWKTMTSVLMRKQYVQNAFTPTDARYSKITRAADALEHILEQFVILQHPHHHQQSAQRRRYDLEEMLKRAAGFAFLLFSQPCSWTFDWDSGDDDSLVIFPALDQISDESGQLLRVPRSFTAKEALRI